MVLITIKMNILFNIRLYGVTNVCQLNSIINKHIITIVIQKILYMMIYQSIKYRSNIIYDDISIDFRRLSLLNVKGISLNILQYCSNKLLIHY